MDAFGPYEVLARVAVGSTGTVYKARHDELGRLVAIKELHPGLLAAPGVVERFRSEAQMLASLDDEHVVAVFDFVEEPSRVWIAQEWVVGATLQAILDTHGALTPEQALAAVRGALQGLAHAHDRGLVHRDVSPGNVVADMAGTSKLLDFGLAAPVGGTSASGTPAFISPEAARGDAVGKPSDVYSAAAVLFLALSGGPPFPAPDAATAVRRHLEDPPPTLTGHGPDLAALLTRSMAKDPGARPQDAAELLAALDDVAEKTYGAGWLRRGGLVGLVTATVRAGRGTEPPKAETTTIAAVDTGTVTPPRTRRLPTKPLAAAAVVVLLGGGTATVAALSGSSKPTKPVAQAPIPTPTPTPSPTPALDAAVAPQGTYALTVTLSASDNPIQPPGTVLTGTWTVATSCAAVPCTGTVTSTSGARYTSTWDGTTLTMTGTRESPCLNARTQVPIPGTEGSYHEDITGSMAATPDPNDPPTTLSGVFTAVQTLVRSSASCHGTAPTHQTRQTVIRKVA